MAACPGCGKELSGEFSFCPFCAAPLVRPGREQRKTVTVVFCDVTGSTALGEASDPEVLRALLARYFDRMRELVEAHGGTVEKFIGDAVMAVFGVPVAHEDDALRAVRAAAEMSEAVRSLGIQVRIGVNTGEVVTGTEERLATGDAVNVAARLEQAAGPGEVLLGDETMRLVESAIEADPVGLLELKGKAEPVPAFRLVRVGEAPERAHGSVFVGRDRELELILETWERVVVDERCELLTIVAEAGIGKTRLVAEALSQIGARVVRGRCLPYGDGITYWPVVEVVKQLGAQPADPAAARALASLLDETVGGSSAEEIAWGFRKLLEQQAPLVCVFDDLQWGEGTFLDLIEHVALLSAGAPVLLLCTARPELLDLRPAWPVALRLEPLEADAVDRLVPGTLPDDLRGRITHAAGGNPLFVVEMVAMAGDGRGDITVPPTLQALLTARLDQLDQPERLVLERGAVEGEIFHRGAVQTLIPGETQVTARLASLVRRELVRPDRAQIPGEDGFRFRHLLIRDAAYEGLPKSVRAELHASFSVWLAEHGTGLVELDELTGHHLEQAARYRIELGQPDAELARRAGARLAAAGRRAFWRSDFKAAENLLRRSLELTRPYELDVALELDLASAVSMNMGLRAAVDIAEAAAERAREAGDRPREALARASVEHRLVWLNVETGIDALEALLTEALQGLDGERDHAELVHVWSLFSYGVANFRARFEDVANAARESLRHARLAGWHGWRTYTLQMALILGPEPADDAIRELQATLPSESHPETDLTYAMLLAMLGRHDESRRLTDDALRRYSDLLGEEIHDPYSAEVAILAGDLERAADHYASFCARLERRGQVGNSSVYEPRLGRILCSLGRYAEAEPLARRGRELTTPGDIASEMAWRQTQALVDSQRGDHAGAEKLAREAVAFGEETDSLNGQGDALCDLAEVLAAGGRPSEARAALERALDRYERKANVAMAERTRVRIAGLG